MNKIFDKNVPGMTEILQTKCIAIAGCGGLGSNAATSLVRAGIGSLKLADFDKVEKSNLNRQYFFQTDLGKNKVEALSNHLLNINPLVKIKPYLQELKPDNLNSFFHDVDLLIEAFDKAESKLFLIEAWCTLNPKKPIIVGSGLSGLGSTSTLKVEQAGNIYFCGDGKSELSLGLSAARVAITANMQANVAIELLVRGTTS